jgi:Uma2 family endonuclease
MLQSMNVALRKPMTLPQFLAWEERQELRYEWDGVRATAMTGGTYAHDTIAMNLARELGTRLRGKPCQPHGRDLKIEVVGHIRYPDAYVSCGTYEGNTKFIREPVVIFEVLSETSVNRDLVVKNQEYRATPSVQRYVVLEQTHAAAIMFSRRDDAWVSEVVAGLDGALHLPEIGIELPLADLYERIELAAAEDDGDT